MKIQIASDIHFERFPAKAKLPIKIVGDILILAGDVSDCPKSFMEFLSVLAPKVPVYMVLGNHEHYFVGLEDAVSVYRNIASRYEHAPIKILSKFESEVIDGIEIMGDTLWTDFARGKHKADAQRNMWEFFEGHMGGNTNPDKIIKWHSYLEAKLDYALDSRDKTNKTIVVSHHTPSFQCCGMKFVGDKMNGAFHSNMDDLIVEYKPDLWIFGHVHDSVDITIGETRVVANPYGYLGYQVNNRYNPELVIEV